MPAQDKNIIVIHRYPDNYVVSKKCKSCGGEFQKRYYGKYVNCESCRKVHKKIRDLKDKLDIYSREYLKKRHLLNTKLNLAKTPAVYRELDQELLKVHLDFKEKERTFDTIRKELIRAIKMQKFQHCVKNEMT